MISFEGSNEIVCSRRKPQAVCDKRFLYPVASQA
jgi:hypothetical protein